MKLRFVPRSSSGMGAVLRWVLRVLTLLFLLMTLLCIWGTDAYGNISLEEIIFYLSMPLRGTSQSFAHSLILHALLPFALATVLFLVLTFLMRGRALRLTLSGGRSLQLLPVPMALLLPCLLVWGFFLYTTGDRLLDISGYIDGHLHQSTLIEENYADPATTAITFPEKKRNLITLYIESAESTNQDIQSGGRMDKNYMPELTQLARDNVSFSQNELIAGAAVAPACGWTVAGMVAQTAGLPLKFFTYQNETDNMGADLRNFLPGATTLGDILQGEGYRNVFLCGSDFDFGGRRQLYIQHGAYEIHDYYTAEHEGLIPEGYYYGWGFEDKRLYEMAENLLTELAAGDQPFHLGLLTVDTHDPGYLCDLCPQTDENIYGRTVQCSSKQAAAFVAWCQAQPWYADTVIVITGDHASMTKTFYEDHVADYQKHEGDTNRLVYNVFLGAVAEPVRMKNRKFTTMDFFPTILGAMGVSIEGERLGLGTNLFSDRQTLSEELGYDVFFEELNKHSDFYDRKLLR